MRSSSSAALPLLLLQLFFAAPAAFALASAAADTHSPAAEAAAEAGEPGRLSLLVRASPLLAREMLRTYAPVADVLLSAALQRAGWMRLWQLEEDEDEEQREVVNPYAARYTQFMQDRSTKGSHSDAQRLLKHGYDKYRYVSRAFLERNPLPHELEKQAEETATSEERRQQQKHVIRGQKKAKTTKLVTGRSRGSDRHD